MIVALATACASVPASKPGDATASFTAPVVAKITSGAAMDAVDLVYVPWQHDPPDFAGENVIWHFFGFMIAYEIMELASNLLDPTTLVGIEGFPDQSIEAWRQAIVTFSAADDQPVDPEQTERIKVLIVQLSVEERQFIRQLVSASISVGMGLAASDTANRIVGLARAHPDIPFHGVEDTKLRCTIEQHWRAVTSTASARAENPPLDREASHREWQAILDRYERERARCVADASVSALCSLLAIEGPTAVHAIAVILAQPDYGACSSAPKQLDDATFARLDRERTAHAVRTVLTAARSARMQRAMLLFGSAHTKDVIDVARAEGTSLTIACIPSICEQIARDLPELRGTLQAHQRPDPQRRSRR